MTNRRPPPSRHEGYQPPDERSGPRGRRAPPPAPRSSPILLYGGVGLLALAVAAVTFIVMAPLTDLVRREIVAQVRAETGRDLTIAGPASFTFFPSLGVRAGDVSLSAPPEMGGEPLFTAASIDVGVRLLPLLRQEIVVDRLVLHEPVFGLRVDGQGRRSWDMAATAPARPVRLAQADDVQTDAETLRDFSAGGLGLSDSAAAEAAAPRRAPEALSLAAIRIEGGTIRYQDARSGADVRIEAINAEAGLEAITHPLRANGNFTHAQQVIAFDGVLTSPAELFADQPAKLALSLKGAPLALSYDGSVTLGDAPSADGSIEGSAGSLRALVDWLGGKLPPALGFREASLGGTLHASEGLIRLTDARFALDGATATGTINVTTARGKPYVAADLKVANLDLGNYRAGGAAAGETAPRAAPRPTAPPPAAAEPEAPQSIEELLDRPAPAGPQVRGYTQRAGWSGEPLDLTALGLLDADAKLAVTGLVLGDLRVDDSQMTVGLKNSVLETTFEDVKLYQGRGNGSVTLDAGGADAAIAANVQLTGIAVQPLLKDTAAIDWLAGTGDVTLALSGRGASETAIVQSLGGKSNFAVRNGAIIGFNLGGAMRSLSEGKVPDFESSPAEKTDFSELTGSFAIADGIAKNEDLQLASPLLRATGAGTIDLPARSLDYTVRPKLVASLSGQGGERDLRGLEIPLHITGSWEDPDIEPDVAGVINNPEAVEAVKELGKGFKGKSAGEIVEDLFGKKDDGEPSKAEKLLEKFLGR